MPDTEKYILDANIFIEAKRRYYSFNLCPGFWDSLIYHSSMGNLKSIDRVGSELSEGDDLNAWKKHTSNLFASTDDKLVINAYRKINQWVDNQERFSVAEKNKFARDADAWVIAYAKANDAIVVTHEAPAPNSSKVKIPDVCKQFDIEYTNTFDMLQKLNVAFHWEAP